MTNDKLNNFVDYTNTLLKKLNFVNNNKDYEWFVVEDFFKDQSANSLVFNKIDDTTYTVTLDTNKSHYAEEIAALLIVDYNILRYTHNPKGPAITNITSGHGEYFLNGLPASKEEVERSKFNQDFSDHLDKVLNDE